MKKNFKFILPFVLVLMLLLSACGGSKTTSKKIKDINKRPPLKTGIYDFALYDTANFRLADGTLDIKSTDNNRLDGNYNVLNQYVDEIPGLMSKASEFDGQYSIEDSKVSFNMNPKIADANIFMYGTIYKDSITGTWNYSTMRGVQEKGVFNAYYRESNKK